MKDKWKPDLVKVNREKKVAGEQVSGKRRSFFRKTPLHTQCEWKSLQLQNNWDFSYSIQFILKIGYSRDMSLDNDISEVD